MSNLMMTAAEVAEVMDCCESLGYKMIRDLNAELKAKGYITRNARIPRKYFYERVGFEPDLLDTQETVHKKEKEDT